MNMKNDGNTASLFNIQRYSLHDGPGIRTTVFFKGCNLHCIWCHNPESQKSTAELMFYGNRCVKCGKCLDYCEKAFTEKCTRCGRCSSVCLYGAREKCGDMYTVDSVFAKICDDIDYYEVSDGGVTLSGGEPLLQADFVTELLKKCNEHGIHTAVETAGNVPFDVFEKIMPYTNLFLYDIKCIDEKMHIRFTGVSNSIILKNAEKLKKCRCDVLFRMPVIPGFNDGQVDAVSEFVGCGKLELMPYHNMCSAKYVALERKFETENAKIPDEEYIKNLAKSYANVIN